MYISINMVMSRTLLCDMLQLKLPRFRNKSVKLIHSSSAEVEGKGQGGIWVVKRTVLGWRSLTSNFELKVVEADHMDCLGKKSQLLHFLMEDPGQSWVEIAKAKC